MSHTKSEAPPALKGNAAVKQQGRRDDSMSCGTILLFVVASVVLIYGVWLISKKIDDDREAIRLRTNVRVAPPTLFARLVGVDGLDPREPLSPAPLAFHLAVDADGVSRCYRACSGGGDSMLRVSYPGLGEGALVLHRRRAGGAERGRRGHRGCQGGGVCGAAG